MEQDRDRGKFAAKGDQIRAVRTIRLTDKTWELLGDKADENNMSKADYLEALFSGDIQWDSEDSKSEVGFDIDEVSEILLDALKLKPNAGGKIKQKIGEVLTLMGVDPEEIK